MAERWQQEMFNRNFEITDEGEIKARRMVIKIERRRESWRRSSRKYRATKRVEQTRLFEETDE